MSIFSLPEKHQAAFAAGLDLCISSAITKLQDCLSSSQNILGESSGEEVLPTCCFFTARSSFCSCAITFFSLPLKKAPAEFFLFVVPALHISHLHTAGCDLVRLMAGESKCGLTIFRDRSGHTASKCSFGVGWNLRPVLVFHNPSLLEELP